MQLKMEFGIYDVAQIYIKYANLQRDRIDHYRVVTHSGHEIKLDHVEACTLLQMRLTDQSLSVSMDKVTEPEK